jgi:hypothetical protein
MIKAEDVNIAWLMANSSKIADALNALEAISNASVNLSSGGSRAGVVLSGGKAQINIPIQLTHVANSTDATDAADTINRLLRSLRSAGLM